MANQKYLAKSSVELVNYNLAEWISKYKSFEDVPVVVVEPILYFYFLYLSIKL